MTITDHQRPGHGGDAVGRVLLSFPTRIELATKDEMSSPRSWVQIARTGSFVSSRYGAFSITHDDLATMLRNFKEITPKAPTELPVDFDHLSIDPKRPGDGIAAGWMKKLELREHGDELWAEVEWTPDGAQRIANREYKFVSPTFVKDHVHKDGTKIGTTLLAAAVTNHPFLEGMQALTLYSMSAMGDLAFNADAVAHPALPQEHVMNKSTTTLLALAQNYARANNCSLSQAVIRISKDRPELTAAYRDEIGASAEPPKPEPVISLRNHAEASGELLALANAIAKDRHISLSEAVKEAGRRRPDLGAAWERG
jgi:hypothetical protein